MKYFDSGVWDISYTRSLSRETYAGTEKPWKIWSFEKLSIFIEDIFIVYLFFVKPNNLITTSKIQLSCFQKELWSLAKSLSFSGKSKGSLLPGDSFYYLQFNFRIQDSI